MKKSVKIIAGAVVAIALGTGAWIAGQRMQTEMRQCAMRFYVSDEWRQIGQKIKVLPDSIEELIASAVAAEEVIPEEPEDIYTAPAEVTNLLAENEYALGWLKVADTNINYPLMQHPTDNEYFLHRDINGNDYYPGSIYMEMYHDIERKGLHILYGHNMKDGSMFRDVVKFMKADYMASHQDIRIYLADREIVLEPVYCYAKRADGEYRMQIYEQDQLEAFLLRKTGQEITADNIYVLITCSYGSYDERTYLIAREVMTELPDEGPVNP